MKKDERIKLVNSFETYFWCHECVFFFQDYQRHVLVDDVLDLCFFQFIKKQLLFIFQFVRTKRAEDKGI